MTILIYEDMLWGSMCSCRYSVALGKTRHLLADGHTRAEHPGYFSLGMEFNTPSQVTGLNTRGRKEENRAHGAVMGR